MTAPAAFAGPPIFNPGAPGEAARVIGADEAVRMSRAGFTEADVRFMQHMIVHHAQAVEMVALIETRGEDATVRRLGERIAQSQAAEMALMRAWLTSRGQPVEADDLHDGHHGHAAHDGHSGHGDHSDHVGHGDHGHEDHGQGGSHAGHEHHHSHHDERDVPLMPGMLSPAQMDALAAASGAGFDRLFLEGMILHHEGALDMVDALLAEPDAAQDPLLSDFLSAVVADQSAEILRMQSILSEL